METVLFFVTIVFDEIRAKVLCIHTKLIIVCRICCGSKNSNNVLFCSVSDKEPRWTFNFELPLAPSFLP